MSNITPMDHLKHKTKLKQPILERSIEASPEGLLDSSSMTFSNTSVSSLSDIDELSNEKNSTSRSRARALKRAATSEACSEDFHPITHALTYDEYDHDIGELCTHFEKLEHGASLSPLLDEETDETSAYSSSSSSAERFEFFFTPFQVSHDSPEDSKKKKKKECCI